MGEHLADILLRAATVLHWLEKHTEGNALILMSRLLRVHNLDDLDKLEAFVVQAEDAQGEKGPVSE